MDRLFSTTALLGVLRTFDRPTAWLRDTFFPDPIVFNTTEIAFDKLQRRRKLAPFVSPKVAGKARKGRERIVTTFEPAYVKPKGEVSPDETFVRLAGERIGGEMAPEERYMAIVTQQLEDQDNEITRREEWMAAQILQSGMVVVEGDDYPAVTVDFDRDPELTVDLTGSNQWGESGVKVLSSIRSWGTLVAEKSGGAATQVVMGAEASELFQGDTDVREVLDNRRQASGTIEFGPVSTGSEDMVAAYLGSIGMFDFWQYTQKYEDEAGTVRDMLPATGVLLMAPQVFAGAMTHGAIRDLQSLRALARFPKMWPEQDPSVMMMMTQSAPLPVPREVNASLFADVRGGSS